MRKLILIILISSLGYGLNAQTKLDSLWNIWNDNTQADTTRLKAIDDMAWDGYLFSQPDSAFYFAQMQYDLAEKSGLKKQMARALNTQGISSNIRGDYPKALDYFQRSLELYEEMGNKSGIAGSLGNIGTVYQNQGNILNALKYFQRSLKIREEIGDKKGIAGSLNNIGLIYRNQGDYPKALDYHQRGLKIKEEFGDKKGIAIALSNIGLIHRDQGDYPKALDLFQRSLKIEEEMGDKFGITGSLTNIGLIYMDQGNYPKALDYHQRSLKIKEEFNDKQGIAASLNNIGFLYQKQGDYQKAINPCRQGLKLAQEIGDVELQSKACKCLYDGYKATGNGNKALEYHEQMLALDDSLNAKESAKALQKMEFAKQVLADSLVQVEKDLKVEMAHQTEVRQKDKNRNIAIGAGIFFLLLASGFYGRWRYVKKSKAIIEKEKDRSNNLLLNILPADIAEELKIHGKAEARDFDMASILFTDFKGFTQASEKLTAKELIKEINICFKAFDHICETHGVEKIKTIGDAYMAAGGLPVKTEDSTKNTVLAGLEMQTFVSNRIHEKDKLNEMSFKMRLGIHTGPVVAGIVGVKKFQYDIWGDTVNTASRMESSGEIGKVNISESTYALLKDDPEFTFQSRGKIEAKGKGEVEMYFVSKA
jgi:class 3 adenylate cyclase/tetratricopeptide (TPR) repeat protein